MFHARLCHCLAPSPKEKKYFDSPRKTCAILRSKNLRGIEH